MKNVYPTFIKVPWLFKINSVKRFCNLLPFVLFFLFSLNVHSQSNHTVSFTNSASDFNALEKISASAGGTDYYITFDQNNLYIGAFNTSGFAVTDNLAIYIDTDPNGNLLLGNGASTGKLYNGVTATLPFKADYNVYAEQSVQQANSYTTSWVAAAGPIFSTSANAREVKIPFASMGNPYALNITLWIGNTGTIYSNVPGANVASSATPVFASFFGTFGVRNGVQGNVNPVNVITSPATGYLSASGIVAGGTYAYIDVTGAATISNVITLPPGGVINVNTGKTLTSSATINNTAITNNTKSTQINVSGIYTLNGRANCSYFNVNNGATYNHNSPGSDANGVATDWPGIDTRAYGANSNVNILQWATTSATAVLGIPAPTFGGWGNVNFNITKQKFGCNWMLAGAFNNVSGNLILTNIGIPSTYNYLTFNDDFTTTGKMNIGGNFEMNTPSGNDIYFNFALNVNVIFTLNVMGDFIVKGGHIKFGHKRGKVIVNYWGNYNQTGGEVRAETINGVAINAYGINKSISASYSPFSGTNFNTTDITFVIKNGAIIYLNSTIPLSGDNYLDPSNCEFIIEGTLNCNGYQIIDFGGTTFTLSPGGTLGICDKNGIASQGNNLGSIQTQYRNFSTQANYVYNGTSSQITGLGLPTTVNSLTINNSSNSNTVSLTNDVTITSYNEIDKGIFSLGPKNVTLHSDANGTASFNALGAGATINYGGGHYTVERYINSGKGAGQHGKSWQLLSTPANGGTVFNTWQESKSTAPGYGTWITDPSGTANGFDAISFSPSMKTYNPATNGFDGISLTSISIANPVGYFLFVRGDRTANTLSALPTPTTLRITGKLFTGNQPAINVPGNSFQSIGNPYASAVNFQTLFSNSSNIAKSYYVWDPSLNGLYGVGGYQTVAEATGYIAVPGGSTIYKTSTNYSNIQSGEAVFVHSSGASPGSVIFTESCKNTGSILVNRQASPAGETQLLFANLYTSTGIIADGNAVAFDYSFSNKIDGDDAIKLKNAGENFWIKRDSVGLAVEARQPVLQSDTIFYSMNNLKNQAYRLLFAPKNMDQNLNAFLIDQYLKSSIPLSLEDSTYINFSVNSDAASSSANRFMIVFGPAAGPLAVTFVSVNSYKQNTKVLVEWKVENESNMQNYEVEHSTDGTHFSLIATIAALNISKATYDYIDENPTGGNNYYRIRSLEKDGKVAYSYIVKVFMGNLNSSISVYPNPLAGENVNLQFIDQLAGNYYIRLLNSAGQLILSKEINHPGGNGTQTLRLNKNAASGIYQLEIIKPDGEKMVIKVRK